VSYLDSSPYYRWDNSVEPRTEAFPPGFRMIAGTTDAGSGSGGEMGSNMFTECCDFVNGDEQCQSWERLYFPTQKCDSVGIAFNMPTCWNGQLGDTNNHRDHMAFTIDGSVAGACPPGFNRRLPQVQLFVRIPNYQGGTYQLSDGNTNEWHVDFFGGWEAGKLEDIIENCSPSEQEIDEFNPPCDCTFGEEVRQSFLTPNPNVANLPTMCASDVRRLIVDEPIDGISSLPRGTCAGPTLIPKSYDALSDDLYVCTGGEYPGPDEDEDGQDVSEDEDGSEDEDQDQDEDEEGDGEDEDGDDGEDGGDNDSCIEKKSAKFFYGYKRDSDGTIIKAKKKRCKWLKKQKNKGKKKWKKICRRKKGYENFGPAKIVCCETCAMSS